MPGGVSSGGSGLRHTAARRSGLPARSCPVSHRRDAPCGFVIPAVCPYHSASTTRRPGASDMPHVFRASILIRSLACVAGLVCAPVEDVTAAAPPDIVYVLADDLGWHDVGFHGSGLRTPALDRLAREGAVMNAFYSQAFSSQTRAALLTGRYPMRYGLQTLSITAGSDYGLPVAERTLADVLHDAGYRTAFLGNWLLGHARPEFRPTHRGFDVFYGSLAGNPDGIVAGKGRRDWWRNDRPARDAGNVTELVAREAEALIGRHDGTRPLFLMVAFNTPSQYLRVPRPLFDSYADIADDTRRSYAAAVTQLDEAVGRIVASLDRQGMLADTLFVFQSDNGGAIPMRFATGDGDVPRPAADNGAFREGKGSLYEGGLRTVALARWPGHIPPGTVVTAPLHVTDLFTTIAATAGATLATDPPLDGVDVGAVLAGHGRTPRKELLLDVEDFQGAIRVGQWKLIVRAALPTRVELFDIDNDPGEAVNEASNYPDRVRELLGRLNDYAYDMAPAHYLDARIEAGERVFWRPNVPQR
ncbi:MAG: sulfatase-like hydrolase/transferase [Betaproteobacteria bacterium]|nr:sulfatase-like hydrolase/transferase [Betaproteobacteria bacterium]